MKQDIGIDFGTAIAYLVPGVITTRGVSFFYPELQKLFRFGSEGKSDLAVFAMLVLVGLAVGLIVSAVRAATIDWSFALSVAWLRDLTLAPLPDGEMKSAALEALEYFGSVKREDPVFARLTVNDRLPAYREAVAADKRPYQFYGNLLIALAIYLGGATLEPVRLHTTHPWLLRSAYVGAFGMLYAAARRSHFRYMRSVKQLNSLRLDVPTGPAAS